MVNNIDKVFAFFGTYILVEKQIHENQMILGIIQRIKLQLGDKMSENECFQLQVMAAIN